MSIHFPVRRFKVWERAVYKAEIVESRYMQTAVSGFAGVECLHLSGSASLSSSSNPVEWIASDGSARQFTCHEVRNDI